MPTRPLGPGAREAATHDERRALGELSPAPARTTALPEWQLYVVGPPPGWISPGSRAQGCDLCCKALYRTPVTAGAMRHGRGRRAAATGRRRPRYLAIPMSAVPPTREVVEVAAARAKPT